MNGIRRLLAFLVGVCVFGCRTISEPPRPHNEEAVLRVWDALASRYGSDGLFECEYLRVLDGKIEIEKPYAVSDIAVLAYSPSRSAVTFFRTVDSNPAEGEVVVDGATLHFHPCHKGESLFVAWKRHLAESQPGTLTECMRLKK